MGSSLYDPIVAKVAVWFDQAKAEQLWKFGINTFQRYTGEILTHAGLPFDWVHERSEFIHKKYDIVIAALIPEDEEGASILRSLAEQGATVISYGGMDRLAKQLGYRPAELSGPGYAEWDNESENPLRYTRAIPWHRVYDEGFMKEASGALKDRSPDGPVIGEALQKFRIGSGSIERWSVDIPHTVVTMQQGTGPVLEDGIPAIDGSGNLDEGMLKADDCFAMNWEFDRLKTETGATYFAYPYADQWKEVLVNHILVAVLSKGMTLPFVGYWPEGVEQVAMISHDSDVNKDESAVTTLKLLESHGIHTTWCMLEPGYSPNVHEQIEAAGHEPALHYNAVARDDGVWDKQAFQHQSQWAKDQFKQPIVSNKNHYTRFEGWGELFQWCEQEGIESDQTRGPSKKGNIGFLFGTCHPYVPIAWSDECNRFYNVIEIGFLTQDLNLPRIADTSVIEPFLEQVCKRKGVAHFLFHQIHIHRVEEVQEALSEVVAKATQRGFVFWTGKQINDWVRSRRQIQLVNMKDSDTVEIFATSIEVPVVWIPLAKTAPSDMDNVELRFGIYCKRAKINRKTLNIQEETNQ